MVRILHEKWYDAWFSSFSKAVETSLLHAPHFALQPPHHRRRELREALFTVCRLMTTTSVYFSMCQPTGFSSVGWILSQRRAGSFQFINWKMKQLKKKKKLQIFWPVTTGMCSHAHLSPITMSSFLSFYSLAPAKIKSQGVLSHIL